MLAIDSPLIYKKEAVVRIGTTDFSFDQLSQFNREDLLLAEAQLKIDCNIIERQLSELKAEIKRAKAENCDTLILESKLQKTEMSLCLKKCGVEILVWHIVRREYEMIPFLAEVLMDYLPHDVAERLIAIADQRCLQHKEESKDIPKPILKTDHWVMS